MAISILNFKKFAKIYVPPTEAKPSYGIVVFTKNPLGNNIVNVPKGTIVSTATGLRFVTQEVLELNQSETFQPIGVKSQATGANTNIPTGQTWSSPIAGADVTNPQPFSGGSDYDPGVPSDAQTVDWIPPDEDVIQSCLDVASKNVLTKLGNPQALPDFPAIDRSVYLFAQFYVQNRNTQEVQTSFKGGDIEKSKTEYYRERVFQAINKEVDNLLRPYVDVSAFMPGVPA